MVDTRHKYTNRKCKMRDYCHEHVELAIGKLRTSQQEREN